jgi:hypothetical protein
MANYKRKDARAWANEMLVGCSGVTIPSYSADLKQLNEQGIRHDIQKLVDLGFTYTLLCTEVAITPEENAQFTAWAKDTTPLCALRAQAHRQAAPLTETYDLGSLNRSLWYSWTPGLVPYVPDLQRKCQY